MKKFIVFILFFIFLSCNNMRITRNVYSRTFNEKDYALTDIQYQLEDYSIIIPPIENWMTLYCEYDTISIEQKVLHKILNEKSRYQFIFTSYNYPSSSRYNFTIRFVGLKKDLQ